MSRVSVLEQLKVPRKSALDFHFEELNAPPIMALFSPKDLEELNWIATSIRFNGNIHKKYELIDTVMRRRGFRRAHSGTNRVVYNFLESPDFVAKVAVDKVGMTDSPREYINQQYFQPFCCKVFEVVPSGVLGFIERVNPISSIEEFISVKDDIFNMLMTKIIGKYVVDDIGTSSYMNYGIRQNSNGFTFGPVLIDFPYVYELDGAKLKCQTMLTDRATGMVGPCGGDIDYDAGFNKLYCTRCGREYRAMDLAKHNTEVKFVYDSKDEDFIKNMRFRVRTRLVDQDKVLFDSGHSSNHYLTREEFESMSNNQIPIGEMEVKTTIRKRRQNIHEFQDKYYTALQRQYYEELSKKNPFNPVIRAPQPETTVVGKTIRKNKNPDEYNQRTEVEEAVQPKYSGTSIEVSVTVPRVINSEDPYDLIKLTNELEKETFPELNTEYQPSDNNTTPEAEPVPSSVEEETPVVSSFSAVETPKPVYSDEEVAKMVAENAARFKEKVDEGPSSILEPEKDKDPMNNPIIRPYASAPGPVAVDSDYRSNPELTFENQRKNLPKPPVKQAVDEEAESGGYEEHSFSKNKSKLSKKERDRQRRNNRKMKRYNQTNNS